ncbi:MAG: hypothetical protein EBZ62_07970, partial [Sphingobacteriia bacterium]|nr:hypothetical protein [Sphingobacteriia bacterium]
MKFSKLQDRSFDNEGTSPSPFRYECRGLLWLPCLLILWLLGHQAQAIAPFNSRLENPPSAGKAAKPRYSKDLLLLTQWFIGDFDNTKQCRVDTGAQPVESHVVKIWDNYFTDAVWIYEEFQSPP